MTIDAVIWIGLLVAGLLLLGYLVAVLVNPEKW
ncbi:potassium-transporting ATPase subunit F [Paenarthrobacter sp. NPDC090522]